MSSLTPILSIPFLLSLGISLILIGFVGVFFYQKITEQNHKISSMVDLISTMAEEMNYIRSSVQSGGAVNTLPSNSVTQQIPLFTPPQVKTDLINVSDDEDDESNSEDEESDEESCDDDEESDDDSESDEDEEENVRVINISESLLHSIEENGEIEEIPSENNDDMNDSSEDEDDLDEDDKSSVSSQEESKVAVVKLDEIMGEPQEFEPESLLDIDATLLKSIHMTFPTSENIDYKKLSLNKLRQIVSDKNLSSDSSKLKKPELLKLLGVE